MQILSRRTTENLNTQLNSLAFEVYFRPSGNRGPKIVTVKYLKTGAAVHTLITNRNICHLGVKVRYSFCVWGGVYWFGR